MSSYQKPFLTVEQQLTQLDARGLAIPDRDQAAAMLLRVGYQGLSGYWYPMQGILPGTGDPVRGDQFVPGASFEHAAALHRFDSQLRLLALGALERVERAVKVQLAYLLGEHDTFAHTIDRFMSDKFRVLHPGERQSDHDKWIETHKSKIAQRKNSELTDFLVKYGQPLPIWFAIEIMDFGDVSKLVAGLKGKWQVKLARQFGMTRGVDFVSWIRAMVDVRNISAHHDRLWNREIVNHPREPKGLESGVFLPLLSDEPRWRRTYSTLCVLAFLDLQVDDSSDWRIDLYCLLDEFPDGPGIDLDGLGAPRDWQSHPIWEWDPS